MEPNEAVRAGIYAGLIDKNSISLEQYRPRLLINDVTKGQKVLTSLISELNQCDEFFSFSRWHLSPKVEWYHF